MKKGIKKLLGAALTVAMCFTMLPAQTVKAEEDSPYPLTEEQLKDILFGTWKTVDSGEITFDEQLEYKYSDEFRGDLNYNCYYYEASYVVDEDLGEGDFRATYTTDIEKHMECSSDSVEPHTDVYVRDAYSMEDSWRYEATVYAYARSSEEDTSVGEYALEYKILENGETATMEGLINQALVGTSEEEVKEDVTTEVEEDYYLVIYEN